MQSAGKVFRKLVAETLKETKKPLQIAGAINAYSAMLARLAGFKAVYLSGSGVATASHGLPDLGITTLNDVAEDAKRITMVLGHEVPLLVDIDTGFGSAFNIQRTIRELERNGVAAVHLEDQVTAKRCGHRPGKAVVSTQEMVDRIKMAVSSRTDPDFVIMARTDALAVEGLEKAIARAKEYVNAGADMIFAEACTTLDDYKAFVEALNGVPVLANITEWGKTPLFTTEELGSAGVSMVLYPLSAFRAMSAAALKVYTAIKNDGTQRNVIDLMESRAELYEHINYHDYEKKIDELLAGSKSDE